MGHGQNIKIERGVSFLNSSADMSDTTVYIMDMTSLHKPFLSFTLTKQGITIPVSKHFRTEYCMSYT